MQGTLARDESGNNNDAMLINGAEIVYEGGKCDSGVSLLGKLNFVFLSLWSWQTPCKFDEYCPNEKYFLPVTSARQGDLVTELLCISMLLVVASHDFVFYCKFHEDNKEKDVDESFTSML